MQRARHHPQPGLRLRDRCRRRRLGCPASRSRRRVWCPRVGRASTSLPVSVGLMFRSSASGPIALRDGLVVVVFVWTSSVARIRFCGRRCRVSRSRRSPDCFDDSDFDSPGWCTCVPSGPPKSIRRPTVVDSRHGRPRRHRDCHPRGQHEGGQRHSQQPEERRPAIRLHRKPSPKPTWLAL